MSTTIPSENVSFVQSLISSGEFKDASAVIGAALTHLERHRRETECLRAELGPALERLDRGEGIELSDAELDGFFEEIIAEGERELNIGKHVP